MVLISYFFVSMLFTSILYNNTKFLSDALRKMQSTNSITWQSRTLDTVREKADILLFRKSFL